MYAKTMNVKTLVIAAVLAVLVALGGVSGMAYATGGDSSGASIEKAKSAALDQTIGGRVSGTEIGDEEGYFEIEVTREDGSQVDVHLDRDFNVLSTPADNENPDDKDGANDSGG